MKKKFFDKSAFIIILLLLFIYPSICFPDNITTEIRKANRYYKQKNYEKALNIFMNILNNSPTDYRYIILFNLGLTSEKLGDNISSIIFYYESIMTGHPKVRKKKILDKLNKLIDSNFKINEKNIKDFKTIINIYVSLIPQLKNNLLIKKKIELLQQKLTQANFFIGQSNYKNSNYKTADKYFTEVYNTNSKYPNLLKFLILTKLYLYKLYIGVGLGVLILLFILFKLFIGSKKNKLKKYKKKATQSEINIESLTRGKDILIQLSTLLSFIPFFKKKKAIFESSRLAYLKDKGYLCYKQQDFSTSTVIFEKLINLGWSKPEEYFILSELYAKLKKTESAISILKSIDVSDFRDIKIHQKKYYVLLADLYSRLGNAKETIRNLKNAITIAPEDCELYIKIADNNVLLNEYSSAIENLSKAYFIDNSKFVTIETKLLFILKTTAEKEPAYEALIAIYESMNNYDLLLKMYNELLELKPEDIKSLVKLGKIYIKLNQIENAYETFKKIETIKQSVSLYKTLINISEKLGQETDLINYLEKYIQLNEDEQIINKLISIHKSKKDYIKISKLYKKLLDKNSDNKDYYKIYAESLIAANMANNAVPVLIDLVKKYPEESNFALSKINTLINYNEKNLNFLSALIEIYGITEEQEKLIEAYEKIIKTFPEKALIEERKALTSIYKNEKKYDNAIKTAQSIIKFEKNTDNLKILGDLYLTTNKSKEAKIIFENILKLEPANKYAKEKIGELEKIVEDTHIMKYQELLSNDNVTENDKNEFKYKLAEAYYDNGFYKKTIQELKELVDKKNLFKIKAINLTGLSYIALEQTGMAIQHYGNALMTPDLSSDDTIFLKYHLALAYKAHEDLSKAKALFEEIAIQDMNYFDISEQIEKLKNVKSARDGLITNSMINMNQFQVKKTTLERYEILEELGRGAMGIVYEAIDKKLDRKVALKQLPENTDVHSETAQRLFSEAKAVAKLNNPYIVNVFDVGDSEDELYISMEYVDGKPLSVIIHSEDYKFDLNWSKKIICQICEALSYAHKHKIIHRDIKPENIMITDIDSTVKVMDFGLAKAADANTGMTQEGMAIGTAQYMSPEQVRGEEVDNRTDIYALGCTMYEILTTKPPFESKTISALMYKHISVSPQSLKKHNNDIPDCLDKIVLKCLEKDKNLRYKDAAEIITDIEKCL